MQSLSLVCHGLGKTFPSPRGPVEALQNISFHVAPGEFVAIVGPSGCGKSTLLKVLAGLTDYTSGRLVFPGVPTGAKPRSALVFQEHGLFPWLTVVDNVAFGLEAQGVGRAERRERARAFLARIGLAGFGQHYPHEISVGMRQRAGIARAFLTDPDLLLMDEPLSALDAQTKLLLEDELLRIWREHEKTVVYVTHDIEEAVLLADRVLVMSGHPGRIREEVRIPLGRPRDLRDRDRPEVRETTWHIWKAIEDEVRSGLRIPA